MALPQPMSQQNMPQVPKGFQAIPKGYSQQQQGILNQLGPLGLQGLQQGSNIEPILQRARSQFQTQTIPGLAERFTSVGGGQRSSAFQGALGQAGAGLEEGLAGLSAQHQQSLLPLFQSLLGMGLQPQYDIAQQQKAPGFFSQLFGGLGQGLGYAAPLLLGGGGLGSLSGSLGSLGGLFNRQQQPQQQGITDDQLKQILAILGRA